MQEMIELYHDTPHSVVDGSLPLRNLYGKFPEFMDVMAIIRNIYGDDFMEIFEASFKNIENRFNEENHVLTENKNGSKTRSKISQKKLAFPQETLYCMYRLNNTIHQWEIRICIAGKQSTSKNNTVLSACSSFPR